MAPKSKQEQYTPPSRINISTDKSLDIISMVDAS